MSKSHRKPSRRALEPLQRIDDDAATSARGPARIGLADVPARLLASSAVSERLCCALGAGKQSYILSTPDGSLTVEVMVVLEDNGARETFAGGAGTVNWSAGALSSETGCVSLARTELRLFGVLFDGNGKVVPRAELVERTWPGVDGDAGLNALAVYVHMLRNRLAAIGLASALETSRGFGYRLVR
jgi:DNA-binding response OmpR family regulator